MVHFDAPNFKCEFQPDLFSLLPVDEWSVLGTVPCNKNTCAVCLSIVDDVDFRQKRLLLSEELVPKMANFWVASLCRSYHDLSLPLIAFRDKDLTGSIRNQIGSVFVMLHLFAEKIFTAMAPRPQAFPRPQLKNGAQQPGIIISF